MKKFNRGSVFFQTGAIQKTIFRGLEIKKSPFTGLNQSEVNENSFNHLSECLTFKQSERWLLTLAIVFWTESFC